MIVNVMMVLIWALSTDEKTPGSYWPAWTHLAWGVGLAFHAFGAYGPQEDALGREEEKVRQKYG